MSFDPSRNTLSGAASPYLRHHASNPIHWQEWSAEAAAWAKANRRPMLISVGYSSCHWCHVMARESFSDAAVAAYLNEHFLCVKVDREERPDIDKLLMRACVEMTGSGGWPLNVFLSSQMRPFFAVTYAPLSPNYGMPGFLEIIKHVKGEHDAKGGEMERMELGAGRTPDVYEHMLVPALASAYDSVNDGWGGGPKFPPHCALLFSAHYRAETGDERLAEMSKRTLDRMASSGLHDHLQGGFYRYCVDGEWAIPHFEKMLYDQAMHLWNYSVAFREHKEPRYAEIAAGIYRCLEESFRIETAEWQAPGLYASALDADTNGDEGGTYVWSYDELRKALSREELALLSKHYSISKEGNFEGRNHLIRLDAGRPDGLIAVEAKLLSIRKSRPQPFRDDKAVTSWNCLAGIALVQAYRCTGDSNYLSRALQLFDALLSKHTFGTRLARFSIAGKEHGTGSLEDYAAMLLFATYVHEELDGADTRLTGLAERVEEFRSSGRWFERKDWDFLDVQADSFDHPTPSSVAMAELALARTAALLGEPYASEMRYKRPLSHDFLNIAAMLRNGLFHVITAPEKPDWSRLPLNTVLRRGEPATDCYAGKCGALER